MISKTKLNIPRNRAPLYCPISYENEQKYFLNIYERDENMQKVLQLDKNLKENSVTLKYFLIKELKEKFQKSEKDIDEVLESNSKNVQTATLHVQNKCFKKVTKSVGKSMNNTNVKELREIFTRIENDNKKIIKKGVVYPSKTTYDDISPILLGYEKLAQTTPDVVVSDTVTSGVFDCSTELSVVNKGALLNSTAKMPRFPIKKEPLSPTYLTRSMERKRPHFLRSPKSKSTERPSVLSSTGSASRIERPPSVRGRAEGGRGESSGDEGAGSPDTLYRQNLELRHRLEEEASNYKRRLDTYRQAQQHQAALVSRLQAKVLQYKQRCSELENQMVESLPSSHDLSSTRPISLSTGTISAPPGSALDQAQQHLRELREERIHDLDTALKRLDEERRKCDKIMQINTTLREQLEESHKTNEALTTDLQKLTNDWEDLREEMIIKEDEWKDEEQAFTDYYTTEHNRLLGIWRDVVSVKRLFTDVQSTTERDLEKLRSQITSASRDIQTACNTVQTHTYLSGDLPSFVQEKPHYKWEAEISELRAQIESFRIQYDSAQSEIRHRDERVQQLLREITTLEDRCNDAEQNISQMANVQEEVEILQSALRDIAHIVLQDAESHEEDTSHIHLTPATPIPQRSPKRGSSSKSLATPAFAEGTISAVQAALHKYQLLIHELRVKLQSNKEQLILVRKQCQNSDENAVALEGRIGELTALLDASRGHCSQLTQERDTLQKALDALRAEKNALDKNRSEINLMYESLSSDYEKLQKNNSRLQKLVDSLEDEKLFLQSETDRLQKEGDLREMSLRNEEDRNSRLREEILILKDELEKLYLNKDMLEAQKIEADSLITHLEKNKNDLEMDLERIIYERNTYQEALSKAENQGSATEGDKKKLQDDLKRVEEEKAIFQSQCADQQSDLTSLRKELLQAEQTRLDLESDKVTLNERIKFLEMEKEKTEMELGQVTRERSDLSNQLTVLARKKEALNEELMRVRQRLEQANEMNARINRNLEDLVKENEEKQVVLETNDKEIQRLQEQLASSRAEKEALEAVLFDTQTNLEDNEVKRAQLEKDQQELLIQKEKLKAQISRLTRDLDQSEKRARDIKNTLSKQAGNQEAEFKQTIANIKKQNEEYTKKLLEEKEFIRSSLEKKLQQTIQQLTNEKDTEIQQLRDRIESLQQHIDNICQQHEEVLLRAENDKQQSLLLAHHDQQALQERLEEVRRELEAERGALERLRRESSTRIEQDRANLNQLREELTRMKGKLDETKHKGEEERIRLEMRIEEIRKERDNSQKEVEELKVQLHLTEDKADSLTNQLQETARKLKEAENTTEALRKELTDVRRQLTDSNYEKEKYHSSNKELREHVKRCESEKREQSRSIEEAFQKISSLEEIRTSLEAEKTRLQTEIRDVERERTNTEQRLREAQEEIQKAGSSANQQQAEERELQSRLANECEERERTQQELHQVKKQMVELESNLEATRQEIGRLRARGAEREERGHGREQELLSRLEDSRVREKRLEDQKHNLEVCLADASQQIQELKARLGGAEGRIRALDAQLAQCEATKRDIEQRLSSVGSTLRRIAGIQLDGSVAIPYRLLSPSRRWSPAREHPEGRDGLIDVDPEVVRKGVRNLMQQVAQIERERDDYKTQVANCKKQLMEVTENQSKGESKLSTIVSSLRNIQEEKGSLEAKLGQKQAALQAHSEALKQKTEEVNQMREKVTNLELALQTSSEEKSQCEEKCEKMRGHIARLENEKRGLQDELSRAEARSGKLELQRVSLEGDIQRLQMMLHEKEASIQKMQERFEVQGRTVASLEERCASLKSTIDQLNMSLERAASGENDLRSEIQSLQRTLLDTSSMSQSSTEKLKQLQKSLINAENERRVLAERLDHSQQNAAELRRSKDQLEDIVQHLRSELSSNEVQRAGLESQLRLAVQWPPDSPTTPTTGDERGVAPSSHRYIRTGHDEELSRQLASTQRERSELRGKVDALTEKIRQLESDKRSLERAITTAKSARSKSYERPEKSLIYGDQDSSTECLHHEQEIRELRLKIRRLESQLAEKEAEIARIRMHRPSDFKFDRSEIERARAAQLQAERLLEAREQSHRQQVLRLENQVQMLRDQLNQEIKRRQQYVLRSTRAGREMQQLRQTLGDSLRTVSQDPTLDALLLEHETRKLDSTLASTASLPPGLSLPSTHYETRSITPQPK